jgi:hypothetical protein
MTSSPDSDAGPGASPLTAPSGRRHASRAWVPLLLLILALLDLRTEILLLFDHLTLTSLLVAIKSHCLAVLVLLLQPSLWRRYR